MGAIPRATLCHCALLLTHGFRHGIQRESHASIVDHRPGAARSVIDFGPLEAAIYLACDDGADATTIERWFAGQGIAADAGWIQGFLNELARAKLVFVEDGKALALALPADAGSSAAVYDLEKLAG